MNFTPTAHQIPDLLQHLGQTYPGDAHQFVNWARQYLSQNRPVENFPADNNHGVRLSNNVRVLICPGEDMRGTTSDSGAVEITHGASQPGQEGVSVTNSQRII